jgi:hypothetical protein
MVIIPNCVLCLNECWGFQIKKSFNSISSFGFSKELLNLNNCIKNGQYHKRLWFKDFFSKKILMIKRDKK